MKIKTTTLFLALLLMSYLPMTYSAEANLKPFKLGGYQQLLNRYQNKAFVLIIWSVTCSSCLKEMAFISTLHQQHPELNLVMLTVDGKSANTEINRILTKFNVTTLENWFFFEDNSAKLRFEIDPTWYGELPRTYFFNSDHQRTAISGVISEKKYRQLLNI